MKAFYNVRSELFESVFTSINTQKNRIPFDSEKPINRLRVIMGYLWVIYGFDTGCT